MRYSATFDASTFPWYGNAKNVVREVKRAGKLDVFQHVVEEAFVDCTHITKTAINDFVSFESDLIYSQLGIDLSDEE